MYCYRALMFNTRRETKKAMEDVTTALNLSRKYITAILLKGNLDQPLKVNNNLSLTHNVAFKTINHKPSYSKPMIPH